MRIMMICLLVVSCGRANLAEISQIDEHEHWNQHGLIESSVVTRSAALATGKFQPGMARQQYQWPYQLESIGHTMASYQNYGSDPYFHHGLDIRGDAGLDVLASAGGKVVNIENYVAGNPAYWEVAILDQDGFLWQYHHVDRRSIPQNIWQAYERGEVVEAGTKIGEIYYWSVVTFGERYHHVHLNILDADGNYLNPFSFLEPLPDMQAPEVAAIGLLKNGRRHAASTVSGSYSIYVQAEDLILHQRFLVPPYEIKYRLNQGESKVVWRFDGLPGGDSTKRFVNNLYVPSLTCGNYQCRKPIFDLGFSVQGNQDFTSEVGTHSIEVEVRDFVGHSATKQFQWTVR